MGPCEREGVFVPLWSAGDYLHPLPRLISGAKDHHRWDVVGILAGRLACAIAGLVDAVGTCGPGVIVPFPSRAAVVRERGLDLTHALATKATRHLRAVGLPVRVEAILTHARQVQDQGGLTTTQRRSNIEGCLVGRPGRGNRWVVLVDDVVTTGASLREGVRALSASGEAPMGLATIAATVLRGGSG